MPDEAKKEAPAGQRGKRKLKALQAMSDTNTFGETVQVKAGDLVEEDSPFVTRHPLHFEPSWE